MVCHTMYKCRLDLYYMYTYMYSNTCIHVDSRSTKREREREKPAREIFSREKVLLESERGIDHKLPFPQIEQDIKKSKKEFEYHLKDQKSKRTTLRIPTWSPTVVLTEPEDA